MQTLPRLRLKKGKEKPLLQHHHWIYSGAIASMPEGLIAEVESCEGKRLGIALLSQGHSISGHMVAFGEETLETALKKRIAQASLLRRQWFDPKRTNAIRLINAEGDGVPGLIVDSYAGVLVLQISHPALEKLKDQIVSLLIAECQPSAIYEKSTSFLRKKSGLEEARGLLYREGLKNRELSKEAPQILRPERAVFVSDKGPSEDAQSGVKPTPDKTDFSITNGIYGTEHPEVEILENGLKFAVDLIGGQKTGLFLDQREMRSLVREHSQGRRILNGFAYTGGFSVAALAGGATHVDSVEISARCRQPVEKNLALNSLSQHHFVEADFFEFLRQSDFDYDLAILDPPAFVKKRDDIANGFRAYKELNRIVLGKMPSGSLLLTCSCSYHVDEPLFQNILFRAARESGRAVRILGRHRQALDHPTSIFHPESNYLKSFLLYIE